ncbi:MAG: asparagine synthase (glutamine-hydrolyzing) [Pseudomonadota bacterium]
MCGIAGYAGQFDETLLSNMGRAIAHRGPDGAGQYTDEQHGIGLAHTRLAIIDLSKFGHQPMLSDDGRVVIVFNGEIYNFPALREELEAVGHSFRGHSDTEVLLHLYLEHGQDFLPRLNGIFAFAIWDSRDQSLFLARDHFGVKPFYYTQTDKGYLFGSELKSILQEPSVSRELDVRGIQNALTFLWSPNETTMLKHVRKLPPGHAQVVRGGKVERQWPFYDLTYGRSVKRERDEATLVDELDQQLRAAVESQLISDVPVGAFLSGGLDSSAMVALAKQVNPDLDLQCYSMRFQGSGMTQEAGVEDLPYAQRVADHIGVKLNVVDVDSSLINDLPKMIYHLDEPQADAAALNVERICGLARANGNKVLLSGTGGDDILTGYRRHYALGLERYWSWLPGGVRSGIASAARAMPVNSAFTRRLSKMFSYAKYDPLDRVKSYFFWLPPDRVERLFSHDYRSEAAKISQLDAFVDNAHQADCDPLDAMLFWEMKHFLCDHNLNYTDKLGMAEGVEIRVPLIDPNLVEFAATVPNGFKQRGKVGKYIFKRTMEKYLPHDVIYRPKSGFAVPLRHWLKNELKDYVDDMLSPASIDARGIFNADEVQRMIDEDRRGLNDFSYPIFALLCIEMWLRTFVDQAAPEILAAA